MDKTQLESLVAELVALGEDADELDYWLDIYELIEPAEQAALATNLTKELEALKSIKQAKEAKQKTA